MVTFAFITPGYIYGCFTVINLAIITGDISIHCDAQRGRRLASGGVAKIAGRIFYALSDLRSIGLQTGFQILRNGEFQSHLNGDSRRIKILVIVVCVYGYYARVIATESRRPL